MTKIERKVNSSNKREKGEFKIVKKWNPTGIRKKDTQVETNNKFEALGALEGKSEKQDSPSKDNVVKEITTKKMG